MTNTSNTSSRKNFRRTCWVSAIILALLFLVILFFQGQPSFAAYDSLSPQLQTAIEKSKVKLGQLSSWQEEAYLSDVLSSPGRFVKDYRTQGGIVSNVVVDIEGIRSFLSFYSDQISKVTPINALLAIQVDQQCKRCVSAFETVKKELTEKFEKRGFTILPLSPVDSKRDLAELSGQKGALGWISAVMKSKEDPDHPGEMIEELTLEVRFPGTIVSRIQKGMELSQGDSVERSMNRLSIDAITEMSAKVQSAKTLALMNNDEPHLLIRLRGVTRYSQVAEIKHSLQKQLGQEARVLEREFQSGRVTLAIFSSQSGGSGVGELRSSGVAQLLSQGDYHAMKFKLHSITDKEINGEVITSSR